MKGQQSLLILKWGTVDRPESIMLGIIGYKFGKNYAGIIGCMFTSIIKELLGTKYR